MAIEIVAIHVIFMVHDLISNKNVQSHSNKPQNP